MGRFASTVPFYRRYRQPYPPEFFRQVAGALRLDGSESLIDFGCGPGLLALGFAPYVRRVTGVDPERAMIAAARQAAAEAGVPLNLVEGRAEELPSGLGPFDVVTIGRALHWLEPASTLAVLERVVLPRGAVVVCGAPTLEGPENPWLTAYEDYRYRLSPEKDRRKYGVEAAAFFAGSAFGIRTTIAIRSDRRITAAGLAGRLFSMSNTSPALLGPRADRVAADLRALLAPLAGPDGTFPEVVEARATILERADPDAGFRKTGSRARPRIPKARTRRSPRPR